MARNSKDNYPGGKPELILIAKRQSEFRASEGRLSSMAGEDTTGVEGILKKYKASLIPLFGPTEERVIESVNTHAAAAQQPMQDLSVYYSVDVAENKMESMLNDIAENKYFESAYIKPPVEPPVEKTEGINTMLAMPEPAPPATPNYTNRQGYLNPAPEGVDAQWAWTQAGGRGQNIRIIDIEGNWRFTHEDLTQNQGGVVAGTVHAALSWRNHGTAVLGEYSGDVNTFGVTGICSEATASAISHGSIGSASAINQAANRLRAGDIMLLEMHRPGPRHNYAQRGDQLGYIAVEWWPDDYAAIRNATQRGIIVVEAAGNGAEDLDDVLYQTAAAGFPAGWTNSFRRTNRDSGAIVVGAGAPPPNTHGRNHGADRSRLGFSNYGALIDAQGWGREVTSCGYGDLQGGANEDLWYTDTFSGTSSASPIVVGAIGCIQGMAKARGISVLTPSRVRICLRSTGSPQQDQPTRPSTQRIGNRPDIRAMAACAFPRVKAKEFKEGKELKEFKERKEFKEIEKHEAKDLKDRSKDFKERKEFKEFKELKEKDKDKDVFEGGGKRFEKMREIGPDASSGNIEERLTQLETSVGDLVHFIGSEMRPDLTHSALGSAPDLNSNAEAAKHEKDLKDSEKLPDA